VKKILATFLVGSASAVLAADFVDTAEVISSTPIMERVNEPRQECSPAAEPGKKPECRTVTTEREYVKGYAVIYRYNGRDIRTTLPSDPGPTVRVGIGVIDGARGRKAPSAGALGSNVREVVQPEKSPAPAPARAPATSPEGYQYRY
jgi:uncharacterized protein YcfJ